MKVDTIIITIYSETKQTVWFTRTSKKCIRILHIGVATRGVKSGFGEGAKLAGWVASSFLVISFLFG